MTALGSWSQGMARGCWEYMTTLDSKIYFDLTEAQLHFFHDLDHVGQLLVRPLGEVEWGWHMSGKPIPNHTDGSQ